MTTIKPIPFLAELRELVLQRSLQRMPKWRFRLAPDVVLQLQPKPTVMPSAFAAARGIKPRFHHIEGLAVATEGANGQMLERLPRDRGSPWWQARFALFADTPGSDWNRYRGAARWKRDAGIEGLYRLEDLILEALQGGFFDHFRPEALLRPQCLCCGKQLTDPASMARMIGPECAGTSSLRVPFTITGAVAP
jgi:hypothetical protein